MNLETDEKSTINLPKTNMIIFESKKGFKVAVRPSGTEPKIKYYLFGSGEATPANLLESKDSINNMLTTVGNWLVENAHERVK